MKLLADASGFWLVHKHGVEKRRDSNAGQASKGSVVTFLVLGSELEPFLRNCIKSLRDVEPSVKIVVWTNEKFEFLDAQVNLEVRHIDSKISAGYSAFGSRDFNVVTNLKWTITKSLILEGFSHVVFSDVDIFFLKPFLNELRLISERFPMAVQSENLAGFPPELCTGFMSFSPSALSLLSELEDFAQANKFDTNDQVMLRKFLPTSREAATKVFELNGALYLNGKCGRLLLVGEAQRPLPDAPEVVMFHANWVSGLPKKKELLTTLGLWRV